MNLIDKTLWLFEGRRLVVAVFLISLLNLLVFTGALWWAMSY